MRSKDQHRTVWVNVRYHLDKSARPNASLCDMPPQMPINTRFVLERDEFNKGSRLALQNLPPKIKWAGYVQSGLLVVLMLTGLAYRPGNEMQPVSLAIFILAWLVLITNLIAHGA